MKVDDEEYFCVSAPVFVCQSPLFSFTSFSPSLVVLVQRSRPELQFDVWVSEGALQTLSLRLIHGCCCWSWLAGRWSLLAADTETSWEVERKPRSWFPSCCCYHMLNYIKGSAHRNKKNLTKLISYSHLAVFNHTDSLGFICADCEIHMSKISVTNPKQFCLWRSQCLKITPRFNRQHLFPDSVLLLLIW